MTIPLLEYTPSSQNQRVQGFEVPGDEQLQLLGLDAIPAETDIDDTIRAAYRQIFNEQQMIAANRQVASESLLRSGQITVRDFIRRLLLSDSFRRFNYDTNNNYRFVEMCIQRVLGRSVYSEQEKLSWSIVLATKGLQGFVDQLLTTEEYLSAFGDYTVPYQRRRILPQRDTGELPFARMARYDKYHLKQLYRSGQLRRSGNGVSDRSAAIYNLVIKWVPVLAAALLIVTLLVIPTA
ncbi:MAG: phycobilisome rod-core linker polypeptide [Cyanobacteria bacterium P01_D01_bin.71]